MTSAELYKWIADPSLLTAASLPDLKQLVDDYPCFNAIKMLYLKNLSVLNDVRLNNELKKMAVHVPDRRQLFLLLNTSVSHLQAEAQPENVIDITGKAQPDVNNVPQDASKTDNDKPSISVAASDYVRWLADHAADLPTEEGNGSPLKHQDIIDSVIKNGLNLSGGAFEQPESSSEPSEPASPRQSGSSKKAVNFNGKRPDAEKKSTSAAIDDSSLDESYFTETLARVYIKQQRYDKALEIFRVLSLKYPEKSAYFASQIESLEKIININK